MVQLSGLTTEVMNEKTVHIDECGTLEILELMNDEDATVAGAVRNELEYIAKAVDGITERLRTGGHLIYVGAGTSGRIGVLDASECPPTFGTDAELVQAFIAGGESAITHSSEGAEDDREAGRRLIRDHRIGEKDAVVGIAASGRTPYVLGALEEAGRKGALTVGVSNNKKAELNSLCQVCIAPDVGAEVIMGSTRLKSGTSQKMVLNMISTATMIKLGKVYKNLMVDMRPVNEKLVVRSRRMLELAAGINEMGANRVLEQADGNLKAAIVMAKTQVDLKTALAALSRNDENVSRAIRYLSQNRRVGDAG